MEELWTFYKERNARVVRIYGSTSTLTVLGVYVLSDLLSAHLTPSEILQVNIKIDFSLTFLLKLFPQS